MPRRRRTAIVLTAVLALALAVLAVLAVFAYDAFTGRQTEAVAVPPDDATPEQVVAAYLEALDARDCDTAGALWTSAGGQRSWCGDVAALEDVAIRDHQLESPSDSGHEAGDEVAWVNVTFTLDWRAFRSDGSMPEGSTAWGYLLVRSSPGDPWRITDEGSV